MTAQAAEKIGIAINLGLSKNLKENEIKKVFLKLHNNPKLRKDMGDKGKKLIDGLGTNRIIDIILGEIK